MSWLVPALVPASLARTGPDVLATITHEVRTPLNAVIGMTDLLRQMALPVEAASLVETIHTSGEQLLALVNDLLDSARIEAGHLVLEDVVFVLRDVVEVAVEIAAATSGTKSLSIAAAIDPALPDTLRGDPRRLGQVLSNLLANAVKFTSSGYVRLRVVQVARVDRDVTLRVEVEDSGIGIDPEALPRLFEPFTQADDATGRRFGGSGLGLAIARRIVDAMGARIDVASVPGQGSRFDFQVTLACGDPEDALALPACAGLRVLIASRDAVLVEAIRSQAVRLGADLVVIDEAEALRDGTQARPAALLLDARLMDADDWIRVAADAGVPVVALLPPRSTATVRPRLHLRTPVRISALAHVLTTLRPDLPRAAAPPDAKLPQGAWRVLAVEDNHASQQLISRVLASVDVAVDIVASGEEACQAVTRRPYDLILMDCRLPGMDGVTTTRALRQQPGLDRVPIIGLTASALPGARQASVAAGMVDVLTKPTRPSVLIDALRRWLPHEPASARTVAAVGPSHATSVAPSLLDRDVVDELRRLDLFDDMARAAIRDAPLRLADLRQARQQDDVARMALNAHRLTTLLGNVGWLQAADLAGELEVACHAPAHTDQTALLQALEQVVLDGLPAVQRLIDTPPRRRRACVP